MQSSFSAVDIPFGAVCIVQSIKCSAMLCDQCSAHDVPHDLVGALKDLVNPHIPQVAFYLVVVQVAVASVQLQSVVTHFKSCACER